MNSLDCKILAKSGDRAEVEIASQKLAVPVKYLPSSSQVGDTFLIFLFKKDEGLTDKKMAKAILEEILNGK